MFRVNETKIDIELFHCPYIGCTSNVFTAYNNTFVHIKKCHNPSLVVPSTVSNCEYVFRHPTSGEIMAFNDGNYILLCCNCILPSYKKGFIQLDEIYRYINN